MLRCIWGFVLFVLCGLPLVAQDMTLIITQGGLPYQSQTWFSSGRGEALQQGPRYGNIGTKIIILHRRLIPIKDGWLPCVKIAVILGKVIIIRVNGPVNGWTRN